MKCFAAITQADASAKSIVNLHGPTVRDQFEKIKRGMLGAIEFLRNELGVFSLDVMPYPAMIVPLSRFFATDKAGGIQATAKQKKQLKRWFWRCCFSRRYSSGVGKAHAADIAAMDELKADEKFDVGKFSSAVTHDFFIENKFNIGTVNTKIFILLLASQNPRSLLGNALINLEETLVHCNRSEFHHIYPKKHLQKSGFKNNINSLANFCFLSSADNQKIKDKAPIDYARLIPQPDRTQICRSAALPDAWEQMKFEDFLASRARLLADLAAKLMA
jgi:hypothetical protein